MGTTLKTKLNTIEDNHIYLLRQDGEDKTNHTKFHSITFTLKIKLNTSHSQTTYMTFVLHDTMTKLSPVPQINALKRNNALNFCITNFLACIIIALTNSNKPNYLQMW